MSFIVCPEEYIRCTNCHQGKSWLHKPAYPPSTFKEKPYQKETK